ncbi:hypothetical protein B1Q88_001274 [Salmonella enterica subsp. enterica serovar Bredeney]|uniref:hypothetical protein n=1 Tax=Salmonella enterica TaxID=28901 RepID=UPI0012863B72|nr:hypothetical protein [Salmonella enterica]EHM9716907.1 hypothetical protein [Salmonella enterica subsp. enterica serovar Oranienburg]EIU7320523.1 hypothetical protein [Salmonella enterica subsp. enterica serovar Anatum]EAO2109108.1 hypothetical protein [Salmonella enterica]EBD3418916.1 hypothetical protein [Salmonella enterica]EBH4872575.1 hypothetical protein [Salmonella enterica]
MGDNERFIVKCDVDLEPYPKEAPSMLLRNCTPTLFELIKQKEAFYEINKGRSVIRLVDIKETAHDYRLLFQYANRDASDPAFANLKTGETRIAKKKEDEGLGATLHMVIEKYATNESFPNTYTAVIEEVPGITRGLLSQALTAFFKHCGFTFKKPDGKKDLICRPIVNIEFHASSTLAKTLSTGYLAGITATRKVTKNSLDEEGLISVDEEILKISTKFKRGEGAVKAVKRAYDKLRGMGYGSMRITYKDANRRTGSDSFSLSADRSLKELATAQLAQRDKAILATNIEVCQKEMHQELLGKMVDFLIK